MKMNEFVFCPGALVRLPTSETNFQFISNCVFCQFFSVFHSDVESKLSRRIVVFLTFHLQLRSLKGFQHGLKSVGR